MRKLSLAALLITLLAIPFGAQTKRRKPTPPPPPKVVYVPVPSPVEGPTPKVYAYALSAGAYNSYQFSLPTGGRFSARFIAQGGPNNAIEAWIVDGDGLINFANGASFNQWYQSGLKTVDTINVFLPAGSYWLVFSNRGSIISSKAVTLTVY